jgi:hypothetical protein
MIGLLFTVLFFPLVGLAVSRLTGGANVLLAGAGATGFILFVAAVWHVPLLAVIIATAIVALVVLARSAAILAAATPASSRQRLAGLVPAGCRRSGRLEAGAPLALALVPIFALAATLPLSDYDGRAFWMLKAKAITHESAIDGPFFRGETSYNPRNEYPLLVPLDAAAAMIVARDLDDQHTRWLYVLFAAGFALELYRRGGGAWSAAIFLCLPQILTEPDGGVFSAYSDIALGAFVAAAFFELAERRSPLLLGLFASFAILTKNEGLPLALLLLAIGAFVFRARIAIALAPVVVAIAHLFLWRARIARSDEEDFARTILDLPQHLDRFAGSLGGLLSNIVAVRDWGLFLVAVVLAAIVLVARKQWRPLALAGAVIVPMGLLYAAVYAVAPWELRGMSEHLAPRVITHLLGPVFFLWSAGVRWRGGTGGGKPPLW